MTSKKQTIFKVLKYFFLLCSILLIAYVTLWRPTWHIREVRWDPFWKLIGSLKRGQLNRDDLYNVLLFIPFGFSVGLFLKKKSRTVLLGFFLSLFVEIMQILLQIGWLETEDILTNTLGVFLGCVIAGILHRLILYIRRKRNV